jgi:hypothetical protein
MTHNVTESCKKRVLYWPTKLFVLALLMGLYGGILMILPDPADMGYTALILGGIMLGGTLLSYGFERSVPTGKRQLRRARVFFVISALISSVVAFITLVLCTNMILTICETIIDYIITGLVALFFSLSIITKLYCTVRILTYSERRIMRRKRGREERAARKLAIISGKEAKILRIKEEKARKKQQKIDRINTHKAQMTIDQEAVRADDRNIADIARTQACLPDEDKPSVMKHERSADDSLHHIPAPSTSLARQSMIYLGLTTTFLLIYCSLFVITIRFTLPSIILVGLTIVLSVGFLITLVTNRLNCQRLKRLVALHAMILIIIVLVSENAKSIIQIKSSVSVGPSPWLIVFILFHYLVIATVILHFLLYFKHKSSLLKIYNILHPFSLIYLMGNAIYGASDQSSFQWYVLPLSFIVIVIAIYAHIFQNRVIFRTMTEAEQKDYEVWLYKKRNRNNHNHNPETSAYDRLGIELEQAVADEDFVRAQEIKTAMLQYAQTHPAEIRSYFDGYLIQLVWLGIKCFFVNVFTLYILFPFTLCWKMKWKAKHTVYDGKRLVFDGNGLQLFGKWVLWMFLSIITLGIYTFFVIIRLEKWKASHTHLADDIR